MLVLLSPSYLASPKCKHELWRACRQPVVKLQPSQKCESKPENLWQHEGHCTSRWDWGYVALNLNPSAICAPVFAMRRR